MTLFQVNKQLLSRSIALKRICILTILIHTNNLSIKVSMPFTDMHKWCEKTEQVVLAVKIQHWLQQKNRTWLHTGALLHFNIWMGLTTFLSDKEKERKVIVLLQQSCGQVWQKRSIDKKRHKRTERNGGGACKTEIMS